MIEFVIVGILGISIGSFLTYRKEKVEKNFLNKTISESQKEILEIHEEYNKKIENFNKTVSIMNDREKMFIDIIRKFTSLEKEKKSKKIKKEISFNIDSILDKINISGFDSLTEEEKRILEQYSKK